MSPHIESLLGKSKSALELIAKNNAITFIGIFGSHARGEQTKKSDIDLLVKFNYSEKGIGLFELYRIQKQLEKLLGHKVDIITNPNRFIKPYIEKDLVTVYEKG